MHITIIYKSLAQELHQEVYYGEAQHIYHIQNLSLDNFDAISTT